MAHISLVLADEFQVKTDVAFGFTGVYESIEDLEFQLLEDPRIQYSYDHKRNWKKAFKWPVTIAFTTPNNRFHPSAIKYEVFGEETEFNYRFAEFCEIPKELCIEMIREFQNRMELSRKRHKESVLKYNYRTGRYERKY